MPDINREKNRRRASLACLALAAAILPLAAWKIHALAANENRYQSLAAPDPAKPLATPEPDQLLARYREQADQLKKSTRFMPKPPKPQPPKSCTGIAGDRAFIDGKWVKVGEKVGAGAEVLAIEPTCVKLKWQDGEITLAPMAVASAPPPPKAEPNQQKPKPEPGAQDQAATAPAEAAPAPAQDDPLAWMGVDLPPGVREKILAKWNQASPEEQAQAKQQWAKLSQQQKEQAVQAMANMP